MNRPRGVLISGTLFATLGLFISLLANPPSMWKSSLQGWVGTLLPVGGYLVTLALGCAIGYSINFRATTNRKGARLINDEEYREQFRKLIKQRKYHVIKIFGYTGEVVTNDLIEYGDRYNSQLEIRLLQRNWLVEELDERAHNQRPEARGLRKWNKSDAIKRMAFGKWNHAMKREIRYYSHHPILKGAILCSPDDGKTVAFIGLLRWDPSPRDGGSVFKSVPGHMLMIHSDEGQSAKDIIDRIQSQFDYEWCHGLMAKEITVQQQPLNSVLEIADQNIQSRVRDTSPNLDPP